MSQRKRASNGTFLKNEFKNLQVHEDKPVKPVNVVLIVSIMAVIFGLLALADKCNVIQLTNNGGF